MGMRKVGGASGLRHRCIKRGVKLVPESVVAAPWIEPMSFTRRLPKQQGFAIQRGKAGAVGQYLIRIADANTRVIEFQDPHQCTTRFWISRLLTCD